MTETRYRSSGDLRSSARGFLASVHPTVLLACLVLPVPACGRDDPHAKIPSTAMIGSAFHAVRTRQDCADAKCEIHLVQTAALSDSGAEGQLRQHLYVRVDSRKRLIVAGKTQVLVYDSTGRLAGAFGRKGAGPGEFGRLVNVTIGPGDTIFAFDIEPSRLTVIAPNLSFVRTASFPYTPAFALHDGSFIAALQVPTSDRIGYPIHRLLKDGTIARSFGIGVPQYRADLRAQLSRVVGPGRDGSIWAAAPGRYVLDRWNPISGDKVDSVRVISAWFRESARFGDDLLVRPSPLIESLWEDDLGFVWVLIRDADKDWRPSSERNRTMATGSTPEEIDALYDWVLEVVDPDGGRVVASKRLPTVHRIRPSTQSVSLLSSGPDSSHVVHNVWKVYLSRKEDS